MRHVLRALGVEPEMTRSVLLKMVTSVDWWRRGHRGSSVGEFRESSRFLRRIRISQDSAMS